MRVAATQEARDARNRIIIALVVALVIIVVAYGVGLGQGMRQARAVREMQRTAEDQRDAARLEVTTRDATIRELEARRQLHLALMALDERNFGIAQKHLNAAAIRRRAVRTGQSSGDDRRRAA